MVGEALKGGRLVAAVMAAAGFRSAPPPGPVAAPRQQHAFITAVELGSRERLLAFCAAVQRCSPVGAFVEPVPGARRRCQGLRAGITVEAGPERGRSKGKIQGCGECTRAQGCTRPGLRGGSGSHRVCDSVRQHARKLQAASLIPWPESFERLSIVGSIMMLPSAIDTLLAVDNPHPYLYPEPHIKRPCPGATAGYGDEVVFANGTFIDGSTAELSADGPLRPPYAVYCQASAGRMDFSGSLRQMRLLLLGPSGPPVAGKGVERRDLHA